MRDIRRLARYRYHILSRYFVWSRRAIPWQSLRYSIYISIVKTVLSVEAEPCNRFHNVTWCFVMMIYAIDVSFSHAVPLLLGYSHGKLSPALFLSQSTRQQVQWAHIRHFYNLAMNIIGMARTLNRVITIRNCRNCGTCMSIAWYCTWCFDQSKTRLAISPDIVFFVSRCTCEIVVPLL